MASNNKPIFRYTSVILICLAGALLQSCITVDKEVGRQFIPQSQILSLDTASFVIPVYQDTPDSMQLSGSGAIIVGNINDEILGKSTIATACQFVPEDNFPIGSNPVFEDAYILIPTKEIWAYREDQKYIPQNIYVHLLKTDLTESKIYNGSITEKDYEAEPINDVGSTFVGNDTLLIRLKDEFGRQLLNTPRNENDSISTFTKRFKGLYFRTDDEPLRSGYGRINFFYLSSGYISLYYTCQGEDSLKTYSFYSYSYNPYVGKHESSKIDTKKPTETIYFQGMNGTKPYIDIKTAINNIKDWASKKDIDPSKLVISRAELTLKFPKPENDNFTKLSNYPDSLYAFYKTTTDATTAYLPIHDLYFDTAKGCINRTKLEYSLNITEYFQKMLQKEAVTEKDNLWLCMYRLYSDYYSGSSYLLDNCTYKVAELYGNLSKNPPKIKLTYTILK